MKNWSWLTGDVNWQEYGGTWYRKVDKIYWLLRFENKAEWGDEGYYCQVLRVNLNNIPASEMQAALDGWKDADELMKLEAAVGYGIYSPMGAAEESRWPDMALARARRRAEELIGDVRETRRLLHRPINKIGSTAADFGRGDSLAGLRRTARGVFSGQKPSPEAEIMLKMYAAANGRTLGGKCEVELAVAGELLKNA